MYPPLWPPRWGWIGGNHHARGSTGTLGIVPQWRLSGFPASALHLHSQGFAEEEFPGACICAWSGSMRFILRKLQEPFPHRNSQPFLCNSCWREDYRVNTPSLSPRILTVFNQRHCELETDKLYLEYGTAQGKWVVFQLTKNQMENVLQVFFREWVRVQPNGLWFLNPQGDQLTRLYFAAEIRIYTYNFSSQLVQAL